MKQHWCKTLLCSSFILTMGTVQPAAASLLSLTMDVSQASGLTYEVDSYSNNNRTSLHTYSNGSVSDTFGSTNPTFNVNEGRTQYRDSSGVARIGFDAFDTSLGTIVDATLFYTQQLNVTNTVKSVDNGFAPSSRGSSIFSYRSDWQINNGLTSYALSGQAEEARCRSFGSAGLVNDETGTKSYCYDQHTSLASQFLVRSYQLNAQDIQSLLDGDFGLSATLSVEDFTTDFGAGDDVRYASALMEMTYAGTYLSVNYQAPNSNSPSQVPVPPISALFSLSLLCLLAQRKRVFQR